jgi:hypothetical protein
MGNVLEERYTYPSVIQYRVSDTGEIMNYPPNDGSKYTLIIHNVEAYNELFKSGALTDPKHTGRSQKTIVDNRSAPQ